MVIVAKEQFALAKSDCETVFNNSPFCPPSCFFIKDGVIVGSFVSNPFGRMTYLLKSKYIDGRK